MHTTKAGWHQLCAVLSACLLLQVAAAVDVPSDIDSKPLIDQLLARKAFLAQHMQSAEWKQHIQQQLEARNGSHNQQAVLIVAGGRDMFANAAITLSVIRGHLRSSIPVEIVHYGPNELPPKEILDFIAAYNSSSSSSSSGDATNSSEARGVLGPVFITDALAVAPPEKAAAQHRKLPEGIKSFPAKVYALTHVTRFKQVLLLDADSMPLVDPGLLFNVPAFRRTGSLFWPDLWWNAWVNDTIYTLVGDMKQAPWVGDPHHRLVDSGQILFDRERHPEVLEYMWLLNSHHEWVYKHMHGDKDTFMLAFSMAGKLDMFTRVPCFARDAMREISGHKHKYHHLGMVQSIPPVMLGAAMRAAARGAAAGDSSSRDGTSGAAGMRRLTSRGGTLGAAGTDSSSSSNSSNSRDGTSGTAGMRRLTSRGGTSGAAGTDSSSSSNSRDGTSGTADARRLTMPAMHSSSSTSSSSSGLRQQHWPILQFWATRRLLLQAGGRGWGLLQSDAASGSAGDAAAAAGSAGDAAAAAGSAGDTSAGGAAAGQLALDDPVGMEDPESDEGVRYTGSGDGDGDGDGKTVAGASGVEKDDLGKAASAAQGPAVTAATAGSPAAAGAGVGPQLSAKRARLQYVGVPVFFHRTSFNSKFFPDCLNADKIKSHYCEVEWLSVPLSSDQAGHSLKPNMFAWDEQHIDPHFFTQHCGSNATHTAGSGANHSRATTTGRHLADWQTTHSSSSNSSSRGSLDTVAAAAAAGPRHLQQDATAGAAAGGARRTHRKRRRPVIESYGLPPEHSCKKLPVGENVMPIPIMRVGMFPYFERVLKASYEAFDIVRRVAGIGF